MTTYSRGRAVINLVDRSENHGQYFHSWCCANSFLTVINSVMYLAQLMLRYLILTVALEQVHCLKALD